MCSKCNARELVDACAANAGFPLTRPQADFISCLLVAAMAVLPEFILALTGCLTGVGTPPASGFDPGNRPRCGS